MAGLSKVPSTAGELKQSMRTLYENIRSADSVVLNESTAEVSVHLGDAGDLVLPIARTRLYAAREMVERILRSAHAGFPPSDSDVEALFEDVDQHAG